MDILLARTDIKEKPKKVKVTKLKDEVAEAGNKYFILTEKIHTKI